MYQWFCLGREKIKVWWNASQKCLQVPQNKELHVFWDVGLSYLPVIWAQCFPRSRQGLQFWSERKGETTSSSWKAWTENEPHSVFYFSCNCRWFSSFRCKVPLCEKSFWFYSIQSGTAPRLSCLKLALVEISLRSDTEPKEAAQPPADFLWARRLGSQTLIGAKKGSDLKSALLRDSIWRCMSQSLFQSSETNSPSNSSVAFQGVTFFFFTLTFLGFPS